MDDSSELVEIHFFAYLNAISTTGTDICRAIVPSLFQESVPFLFIVESSAMPRKLLSPTSHNMGLTGIAELHVCTSASDTSGSFNFANLYSPTDNPLPV